MSSPWKTFTGYSVNTDLVPPMVPTFHHTIRFNTSNSVNSPKNTNTDSYTNEFHEIAHTWFDVKKGNVNFLNFLSKHIFPPLVCHSCPAQSSLATLVLLFLELTKLIPTFGFSVPGTLDSVLHCTTPLSFVQLWRIHVM